MDTRSDDFNRAVGAQLRAEIAAAGLSVSSASREAGIPRGTLIRYLDGERDVPVTVPYRISAITGVPVERIIDRAEERLESSRELAPVSRLRRPVSDPDETLPASTEAIAAHEDPSVQDEFEAMEQGE